MCGSHQQSVTCLCGKTWVFQQLQCSFSSNLFKAQWTLKNVYQLLKRHLAGSTDTCYVEKFDICKETRRSIFTFDGAAVSLERWDQSGQNAQCLWWYQLSNMVANEWFLLVLLIFAVTAAQAWPKISHPTGQWQGHHVKDWWGHAVNDYFRVPESCGNSDVKEKLFCCWFWLMECS